MLPFSPSFSSIPSSSSSISVAGNSPSRRAPWVGLTSARPFNSTLKTQMSSLLKNKRGSLNSWSYSFHFTKFLVTCFVNGRLFILIYICRYGSVFKTHILGCPCVMVSSPEAMKFVLVTKAHLFKPTFPASKERMLGKQAIFFHQGDYHAKLRKLVLRAFLPQAIKNIVPSIESIAKDSLQSMEGRLINTFQEMKTVSSPHLDFPRFL
jgi:hypothetical protein